MTNEKLFEYATETVREHGGDGNVLVVLKQQRVIEVADEFERWQVERWPSNVGKRMKRIVSPHNDPSRAIFSDMSNENLHFVQWNSYDRFLRGEIYESIPIDEEGHKHWDTVVVTW